MDTLARGRTVSIEVLLSQSAELREHAGLLLQVSAIAISGFAAVEASWGVNSWLAMATVTSLGLGVLLTFMGLGKVPYVATDDEADVLVKIVRGKRALVRVATWVVFVAALLALYRRSSLSDLTAEATGGPLRAAR